MPKDCDTEQVLKPVRRFLSRDGMAIGRLGIHLWRWGGSAMLAWLAFKPEAKLEGITKQELTTIMAAHEARCEQIVQDSKEQIRELNRRIDLLLRQRWTTPVPRGGQDLMRKEQ